VVTKTVRRDDDWTFKTVATAFVVAMVLLAVALALSLNGLWPDVPWSELAFAGMGGAVYLAWEHPRRRILAFAVFLPVCLFALFFLMPTFAGLLNRLFGV
jgi:hypothetical protein